MFFVMTSSMKNATSQKQSNAKPTAIPGYTTLAWSDEFNTDGTPNQAIWGYGIENGLDG